MSPTYKANSTPCATHCEVRLTPNLASYPGSNPNPNPFLPRIY